MAAHPNNCWEAPKFNFNYPHHLEDWKVFNTRVLDYLETLNINTDEADDQHTGWKQLKMMFKGEDRQTLQSLIDSGTITVEHQKTPQETWSITRLYPFYFYVFKDATSPQILLSYATSETRDLGIYSPQPSSTVPNRDPQCSFFPCPRQLEEDCQIHHLP